MTFKDNNGTPLVVRSEDYYPFGATSRAWSTQTLAEMKFKYQGKERDTETGYDYFEARTYDPQLGRFLQVDPLYEDPKQIGQNPFSAMGNNPVSLVDPTGKIWENTDDRDRLKKEVNGAIDRHQKEIEERKNRDETYDSDDEKKENQEKIKDLEDQIGQLNQSLNDIDAIDKAEEVFRLDGSVSKDGTVSVSKDKDGTILIGGPGTTEQIHEIRHIGNSLANGGLKFAESDGKLRLQYVSPKKSGQRDEEVSAYQAGFSMWGSYPVPVGGTMTLKQITPESLKQIRDGNNKPAYEKLF